MSLTAISNEPNPKEKRVNEMQREQRNGLETVVILATISRNPIEAPKIRRKNGKAIREMNRKITPCISGKAVETLNAIDIKSKATKTRY